MGKSEFDKIIERIFNQLELTDENENDITAIKAMFTDKESTVIEETDSWQAKFTELESRYKERFLNGNTDDIKKGFKEIENIEDETEDLEEETFDSLLEKKEN